MDELEHQASNVPQALGTTGWSIPDAAIVGVIGCGALVFFVLLSTFVEYSIPSFHSLLRVHGLETDIPVLASVVGVIALGGPLVMWFVRRRNFTSLAQSIEWECTNQTLGWTFLAGCLSGIVYSTAKAALAGRGYQAEQLASIVAFVVLAGFAQPAVEEIYFRGILFVAVARKFGDIPSIAMVTLLFCVAHPQHGFTVLPIAIVLGAVRLHTRSVKACFACHAAYNLSLVLFMLPNR